jgi:hypothetical protein
VPPTNQEAVIRKVAAKWTPDKRATLLEQLKPKLWRQGDLEAFKFHSTQRKIYAALTAKAHDQFFLLCSRRLGKTYMLLTLAFQECLKHPDRRVLFLAPEKQMAREITTDTAAQLLKDCPKELKSQIEFKTQFGEYHFPNGSVLRLKGVNAEQADSLRGGATHLVIIDEAGQMDNLEYIVNSVVMPMTLTTKGRIIFATTPPTTPDHDSKRIYDRLFAQNATVKFTILDAPHIDAEDKARQLRSLGEVEEDIPRILAGEQMPKTTAALRELFGEFITDASMKVVKEFDVEAKKVIVRRTERPSQFDAYVAMDPGFQDRTGLLFAHYDFTTGNIVVEAEALLWQASTSKIAECIAETEYKLWGHQRPLLRVSDVDPRLVADLFERHGLVFVQAQKQDSLGAINLVRTMVQNRELTINPDCIQTVYQLENTIWNKKATDFERTSEGHGDLLAALKYLCRHVNRRRNPNAGARPGSPEEFRSPRRRFWGPKYGDQMDLLGKTPFAKRVKRSRAGDALD